MSLDAFLAEELATLEAQGRRRRIRPVDGPQRAVVRVDGREAINFSSNNYLGLADSPVLREAVCRSLEDDGVGAGASRLIAGTLRPHRELEEILARFHEVEATLLFTSGYQANVGVLSTLAGPDDVIFSDALNHASLIDGCRLSRARSEVYRHSDLDHLDELLRRVPGRRRFIVTDTIFSMDGDLARLAELRSLADRHGAALIIDEAHATGVLGPDGRGLAAATRTRPDVHVATLGKGLGAFGAYVAGSRPLIELLLNRARSFVFTTAPPPGLAAAAIAAIRLCLSPEGAALRARLQENIGAFSAGLQRLGLAPPGAGSSPIFPIHVGDERRVMEISDRLLAAGVYAQGIRPPTVPVGTSRLRFALMATHTPEHIARALDALAQHFPRSHV